MWILLPENYAADIGGLWEASKVGEIVRHERHWNRKLAELWQTVFSSGTVSYLMSFKIILLLFWKISCLNKSSVQFYISLYLTYL